jgi:hypothetical protein
LGSTGPDHHDIAIVNADGRLVAKRRIPESVAGFIELIAMLADAGDDSEVRKTVGAKRYIRSYFSVGLVLRVLDIRPSPTTTGARPDANRRSEHAKTLSCCG